MAQSSEPQPSLWLALEARVRDLVRDKLKGSRHGVAIVRIDALMNSQGDPIFWREPEAFRVEPTSNAMEIILKLICDRMGLDK